MSRKRPLRDSAARRRADARAQRRAAPERRKRVTLITISAFAAGILLGSVLGIVLGRSDLLPPQISRLADRTGAGLTGATQQPARRSGEAERPGGEMVAASESVPAIPASEAAAPEPPRAQERSEASVAPEKLDAPNSSTPESSTRESSTPEPPVSSEALDAASAISIEPPNYPAMDQGSIAEKIAEISPAPMSPPIARVSEPPANRVHVVYEETARTEPAARRPEQPVNLAALVERARSSPEAARPIGAQGRAIWQANAVPAGDPAGRPMIAIVFDDLGLNRPNTRRVIALPGPLTLSFMTYAENLDSMTGAARAAGHELMVHMPMEPMDSSFDPGMNVLLTGLDQEQNLRRLVWGLDRFSGYVGINNHMGSRFTSQPAGMAMVLAELKRRGLLFLDSKTAMNSVGAGLASRFGVPFIERDIFIDNHPENRDSIRRQLDQVETVARRRGAAVAIGHPHSATIEVLAPWLAGLRARGFALVPISTLVRRRIRLAEEGDSAG